MVTQSQQAVMDRAVKHLLSNYSPHGQRVGWLMIASILIEAWDLYSIAFVLIFIREIFHPSPAMLGLAAAGTQGGAVIGALLGGWLSDKIGRRAIFLSTMVMFVVFAVVVAFVVTAGVCLPILFLVAGFVAEIVLISAVGVFVVAILRGPEAVVSVEVAAPVV